MGKKLKEIFIKLLHVFSKYFGSIKIQEMLSKIILQELYKNKKFSDKKNIVSYGFKVFSQQDEDGIIEEIFKRIGAQNKTFIEIGVETGIECNTTYLLLQNWKGLWIEGNKDHKNKILSTFESFLEKNLNLEIQNVNPNNVNQLIKKYFVDGDEIDLLSIDIGTHTYHTLKEINCIRPRLIVLEYNAKYGPSIEWVAKYKEDSSWDGSDYYGASLKSYNKILENKYKLVCCNITGANAFFVRNDLVNDKFINDFSTEYHFNEENFGLRLAFKKIYKVRIN